MDTVSECAMFSALPDIIPIATLDLQIDYLKLSTSQKPLHADARCYRLTRTIGFTRAFAYHDAPQDPAASSVGTFMVGSPNAVFGINDLSVEYPS